MFNLIFQLKPVENACVVDWQNTRYASPALDFFHFIFTATDQKLREKEYSNLMQQYYSTVSRTINKLGSDSRVLFSYNDFMKQLNKFGNYALIFSPFIIQLSLADAKDVVSQDDKTGHYEKGECTSLFNDHTEYSMLKFNKRIVGVISDVIKLEYYTKINKLVKSF